MSSANFLFLFPLSFWLLLLLLLCLCLFDSYFFFFFFFLLYSGCTRSAIMRRAGERIIRRQCSTMNEPTIVIRESVERSSAERLSTTNALRRPWYLSFSFCLYPPHATASIDIAVLLLQSMYGLLPNQSLAHNSIIVSLSDWWTQGAAGGESCCGLYY